MRQKLKTYLFICLLAAASLFAAGKAGLTVWAADSGQSQTGIAEAFQMKDLSELYNKGKLTVTQSGSLSVKDSKSADGLLISGTKEELSGVVFTFSDSFDFSEGVIGRLNVNALSAKANQLKICFYLDDATEPFARMDIRRQKREGKWTVTNQSISLYDQKITGIHKISFRIEQTDAKDKVSFVLRTVTFAKSTVPVMYFNIDESQGSIDGMNNSPDHDTECYGNVTIEIPDEYRCEYADAEGRTDNLKTKTYDLEYIRGRGNSTWSTPKKPYKLKFSKKQDLFNMGKNKHWVLLADYYDPTHIRNKVTYWIGKQLGMDYTPECVYVDVVMNGEYYGSYLLSEQVRLDTERVDLDNLEDVPEAVDEPTISGGYLLSMCPDVLEDGKTFSTSRRNDFLIESPEFEEYTNEAQYNYIKNYVQKTEDAIYGSGFQADGKSYRDYMDVTSAVQYYWLQEFSANGDAFGSTSSYLYKKRNDKLFWGPLWDFDYVAWGNNDFEYYDCEGWMQNDRMWFAQLFKDSAFSKDVIAGWKDVRTQIEAACRDGGVIDQYAKEIEYSMNYNADLYGNNYDEELESCTFDQNVDQLKQWMRKRIQWVDENVSELEASYYTVTFKNGKTVISTQQVFNGDPAVFPKPGTKKGYVFAGWYAKDEYGESYLVDNTTGIFENMTLYAKWIAKKKVKPVQRIVLGYDRLTLPYMEDDEEEYNMGYMPFAVIGGSELPGQIVWSSTNEKVIVPLTEGQFQIVGIGDAVLIASTKDGKVKAKCKIHTAEYCEYDSIFGVSLNKEKANLKKGDSLVLSADLLPENSTDVEVTWICSDEAVSILSVGHKCIVSGIEDGTACVVAVVYGEDGMVSSSCTVSVGSGSKEIKPGSKVTRGKLIYSVVSMTKKGGTVKVSGVADKKMSKVDIPSTIKINKKQYEVVGIAKNAFYKNKKIRQVTVGKNVTSIGEKAFYGCKKLNSITFKGSKLRKIGKKAFKGTASKVWLSIKKTDRIRYRKMLKKAGIRKVKFK